MRYVSMTLRPLRLAAKRAGRALTSGRHTVASQQSSRSHLHIMKWSVPILPKGRRFGNGAHQIGKVPCVISTGPSFFRKTSIPTWAKLSSRNSTGPERVDRNFSILFRTPDTPHPRRSSVWVVMTPTARQFRRNTKKRQVSNLDTSVRRSTANGGAPSFNK